MGARLVATVPRDGYASPFRALPIRVTTILSESSPVTPVAAMSWAGA